MTATPGTAAPDLHVALVDGGFRSLADIVEPGGGIVLFVKSSCEASQLVASRLGPLARSLDREARLFLTVIQDEEGDARAFRDSNGAAGTVAWEGAPYGVSADYGIVTVPTLLVIDGAGVVAERVEGFVKRDYLALGEAVEQALALGDIPPVLERAEELPDIKPG